MIISDLNEAAEYGIQTTQEELDKENLALAFSLSQLIANKTPLERIPKLMSKSGRIFHNINSRQK